MTQVKRSLMLVSMSTDNIEWLTSGTLTTRGPACVNRVPLSLARTDTGETIGTVPAGYQARETPKQARQRKQARKAAKRSRRANR